MHASLHGRKLGGITTWGTGGLTYLVRWELRLQSLRNKVIHSLAFWLNSATKRTKRILDFVHRTFDPTPKASSKTQAKPRGSLAIPRFELKLRHQKRD